MRGHSLAAGVVAASLLVLGLAAVAGPAAAQVDPANEDDICEGAPDGDSLVLVLPSGTYVHAGESVTLLPGTEADVALCSDGQIDPAGADSAWALQGNVDGISIDSTDENSYGIVVDDVTREVSVDLAPAVTSRSVTAPDVTASPGKVTTARVDGEAYQVAFAGDRQEFVDANGSYVATLTGMRSAAERLNRSAGSGSVNRSTFEDVNRTAALRTEYASVQSLLFDSATDGGGAATAALEAYQRRHQNTIAETATHLRNANRKLRGRAASVATTVLANLLGVLVVGAVVGGIGGRAGTNYVLERVENKRRRSSAYDFRLRQLLPQFGVALLLIGIAIGVAVAVGLVEPLVAAVLAVIGV
jgi:hypothetical protein